LSTVIAAVRHAVRRRLKAKIHYTRFPVASP